MKVKLSCKFCITLNKLLEPPASFMITGTSLTVLSFDKARTSTEGPAQGRPSKNLKKGPTCMSGFGLVLSILFCLGKATDLDSECSVLIFARFVFQEWNFKSGLGHHWACQAA